MLQRLPSPVLYCGSITGAGIRNPCPQIGSDSTFSFREAVYKKYPSFKSRSMNSCPRRESIQTLGHLG